MRQLLNLEPIWYNRLQNGLWRYISGIYATSEEATFARDLIRNRGIKDAFVVKYDDAGRRSFTRLMKEGEQQQRQQQEAAAEESRQEARGGRQVVSDESGDIRFMVQIAAYKDGAPFGMIDTYFTSLNIPFSRQRNNDGITVYITGSYSDYKSAEEYKNEIVRKGLSDAFVVAYSNNQRISIQQALNLLNESND